MVIMINVQGQRPMDVGVTVYTRRHCKESTWQVHCQSWNSELDDGALHFVTH
jgi:hypothetical protein